jgi:cytidine deaminase
VSIDLKPTELTTAEATLLCAAAEEACNTGARRDAIGSRYGAAVLSVSGRHYEGRNWFSPSLSLSIHAEHSAVVHAELHDDSEVRAIAIACSDDSHEPVPCGICRQVLFESARVSGLDIVVLTTTSSHQRRYNLSELYPNPWPNRPPRGPRYAP